MSNAEHLAKIDLPRRTERLLLRRAVPEDAATTWAFRSLPEVSEWTGGSQPNLETWRTKVNYDNDDDVTILICLPDGSVIGDLMLIVRDGWAQKEVADQGMDAEALLGWTMDPAYGGQGFGTEAVAELLRICFVDIGVRRVIAECFVANEPSWRLMERLGMRREGHAVKDSLHRTRGWLDGYTYALLRDEWADLNP